MNLTTVITSGLIFLAAFLMSAPASAGPDDFVAGKAIPEFGKISGVDVDQPIYSYMKFKTAFDIGKQAQAGELNRNIVSVARFINMHRAAGIKAKNIKLAIVLHGGAAKDVTKDNYYIGETEKNNANAALVKALLDNGVKIYVCGQTAAYYDIKNADLLPGVQMSLSAMTAHALLQQKGYTLNPF